MAVKDAMIKLKLDNNYDSFSEFYDDNKELIYKSVIKIFQEFLTSKQERLTLSIDTKINNIDWGTDFIFTIQQKITLSRDLLPYFMSIEDYETCVEIRDLVKKLNGDYDPHLIT
jgi:protein-arginine kinase activator protein McsA